jgi:CheY-like chemotaxis protein
MSLLFENAPTRSSRFNRSLGIPDLAAVPGFGERAPASVASEEGQVLLVDDDGLLRETISEFLVENGYAVVAVDNGAEALRKIMAGEFALILCDLMMPTMSGEMFYRAVERIRPQFCDRFAFMTGDRGHPRNRGFLESRQGFVFEKPFQLLDLLHAIAFTNLRVAFAGVSG